MNNILLAITFLLSCFALGNTNKNSNDKLFELKKNQPIIGVLSIPYPYQDTPEEQHFYLYSAYITYFQLVGAKIAVLKYTDSEEILIKQMEQLDGLVLPGGGANLMVHKNNSENNSKSKTESKQFSEFQIKGSFLVNLARQYNDKGRYFPIFGICLGMEVLVLSFAQTEVRSRLSGKNFFSGLEVIHSNINYSRIFRNASRELFHYLSKEKMFYYFQNGLKPFTKKSVLKDHFLPLAYSTDKNGQKYIAALEAKDYPFYGVQFHPEKTGKKLNNGEVLTIKRMQVAQYFADFFHLECLKKIKSNLKSEENLKSGIDELNLDLLFVDQLAPTLNKHKDEVYIFNAQGKQSLHLKYNGEDLDGSNEEIQENENDSSKDENSSGEEEGEKQQQQETTVGSQLDQNLESGYPEAEQQPKQLSSKECQTCNNSVCIGIAIFSILVLLIILGRCLVICFKNRNNNQSYTQQSDQKLQSYEEQLPPQSAQQVQDSDKIQLSPLSISDSL